MAVKYYKTEHEGLSVLGRTLLLLSLSSSAAGGVVGGKERMQGGGKAEALYGMHCVCEVIKCA